MATGLTLQKTTPHKNFPLRLTKKGIYNALEKEAKDKKWSVNTLINSVLENHLKNNSK